MASSSSSNQLVDYVSEYLNVVKRTLDVDKWSHFIDDNIIVARYAPFFVGALGAFAIFRGVRLCTKFTTVSRIPKSFVKKNVELRGRLKEINLDGTLRVEHLPVVSMPWHNAEACLNVRLAYTNPTISGIYWMKLNLNNQSIRFTILDRNMSKNEISALVRTSRFKASLNETLVTRGLATVNASSKASGKQQSTLLTNLVKCEAKAKKEFVGMWEADRKETVMSKSFDAFKKIISKLSSN